MSKRLYMCAAFLIALSTMTMLGNVVAASSIYDLNYRHTNTAEVKGSVCAPRNIASNWSEYIVQENKWIGGNVSERNAAKASFSQALSGGRWGVSEAEQSTGEKYVIVYWTTDNTLSLRWNTTKVTATSLPYKGNYVYISADNSTQPGSCVPNVTSIGLGEYPSGGYSATMSNAPNTSVNIRNLFVYTDYLNYPSGYEGNQIVVSDTWSDMDGDGLVTANELAQGTSDMKKDTDNDGLNDHIESQWYLERQGVFCGVSECAYPDPIKKDIYVEIDWMNDTANSRLLKPSGAQLTYVEDMFESKNINVHLDTGQYGGGNVLPSYMQGLRTEQTSGAVDFGDFKDGGDGIAANFASNRNSIWKYMIYGYGYIKTGDPNYPNLSDSSGLAEVSGDDIFVSGGIVEDIPGLASLDRAVANTIAHEIGHTLCLSPSKQYQEQNSGCVYSGIDNDSYKPQNYRSVMNYRYQLTDEDDMGTVDYSNGVNGSGDHDDWSGVLAGMSDFSGTQTALGTGRTFAKNKTMDPDKIVQETLPVKDNDVNLGQQTYPSAIINMQPLLSNSPHVLYTSKSQDISRREAGRSGKDESFDWTKIGFAGLTVIGAIGTSVWRIWYRK